MNTEALLKRRRAATATKAAVLKKQSAGPVTVIGLGYVGLPLALRAQRCGYQVRGFDTDTGRTKEIRDGAPSFLAETEERMLRKHRIAVSDREEILEGSSLFVICVPTPVHEDGEPDLTPLVSASEAVARHLKHGDMVIIESTVSPGVCESVSLSLLQAVSGLTGEKDFAFAHCPERINPGDEHWNVRTIPRVLGGLGPKSLARAKKFYESILDASIHPMGSIAEAEAVKMVENSFRDVNIAFVNELAMSFAKAGIDISNVLEGAGTKPFGFVPYTPGCGVGGHCIPVDPYYLIRYGRENGFEHRFLITAREINSRMPHYTVDLLETALRENGRTLAGSTIALLGLAYKRDVPDLRESPALHIQEELIGRGARVRAYDPFVPEQSDAVSIADALIGATAVVLATDHQAFESLSPAMLKRHGVHVLIDGRNFLPKQEFLNAGITYRGIGR